MAQHILPGVLLCALLIACESNTSDRSVAVAQTGPARAWLDGVADKNVAPDTYDLAPVSEMVVGLQRRLEDQPNDVKGWKLLAQSYAYTGDMQNAQNAADRAIELGADETTMSTAIMSAHTDRRPAGREQ